MTSQHLYLLGMGLATFKDKGSTLRPAISKGEFTVHLMFRPTTSAADKKSVADALYIFGLLGALGSRARHGMGSISLTTWAGDERQVPTTRDAYKNSIQSVIPNQLADHLPPYTALSAKARIDISAENNDVFKLLTDIGGEQQLYRSFGLNGKVSGQPARRIFTDDHNLIFDAIKHQKAVQTLPERVVFGLPHNYRFTSFDGKGASINYKKNGVTARRSSPLLLHIHRLSDESYLAVNCLLPAKFLPDGASVEVAVSKKKFNVLPQVSWNRITDYLDGFERRETINVQR
jgi:CRISPR-associated protein Cmr1